MNLSGNDFSMEKRRKAVVLHSVIEKGRSTLGDDEETDVKSPENYDFYADNEEKLENVAWNRHPPFKKNTGAAETEATSLKDDGYDKEMMMRELE